MAAYGEGTVWLMNRQIGEAIETAWPSVIKDIDDAAEERWKKRLQSREREIRDLKDALNEERDMTDDFKNDLEKEHEVTKSLEQELKALKEKRSAPRETNDAPQNAPRAKPRAGPSSRPAESAQFKRIQTETTPQVCRFSLHNHEVSYGSIV